MKALRRFFIPGFTIFSLILILSCARQIYNVAYPTLNDGKYDSEFPYKSCSQELDRIVETVKRLHSSAYYESYVIPAEARLTRENLKSIKDYAVEKIYYNRSSSGTGTIFYFDGRRVAILTCAHIMDYPDTIFTYYADSDGNSTDLHTVAFKKSQTNFVADLPERGELDILAVDADLDVAILGREYEDRPPMGLPVLDYPLGQAKQLEWGSFVYLVGYPIGYQMVTKGIVSSPNRDRNGSFLVDALFNKGFSGGLVLAIKDGVPNFELVGMARAVSGNFQYILKPDPHMSEELYDPNIPYNDDIYVEYKQDINYGVTHVVSIEAIMHFIRRNEMKFSLNGFNFDNIFQNDLEQAAESDTSKTE